LDASPFAIFIGRIRCELPLKSLTILYSFLESPVIAASSACESLSSTHFFLSALHLFLTSLSRRANSGKITISFGALV